MLPTFVRRLPALLVSLAVLAGPARAQSPARIVAVGDVHGDADGLASILTEAGILDASRHWRGGTTTLVQLGDLPDRGTQVRDVFELCMAIERDAAAAGGRAVFLIGNHEAMNVIAEVRDVAPAAYAAFADAQSESRREQAWAAHRDLAKKRRAALAEIAPQAAVPAVFADPAHDAWMAAHPPGMLEYLEAMSASGRYGAWIRGHLPVVRVGDTMFLHGGWSPEVAPGDLDQATARVHDEIARWDRARQYLIEHKLGLPGFTFRELLDAARVELARVAADARRNASGPADGPIASAEVARALARHPLSDVLAIDRTWLLSPTGPLWFRGFATWTDEQGAPQVAELERRFGGHTVFVVGHSITQTHRITPRFDNRVVLIDTALSSVYRSQGGRPSALEIDGTRYGAIYSGERTPLFDTGR